MTDPTAHVKIYTVNGAATGSSSSLPDWLTRKRAAKRGKRAVREQVEGTIELVQEFEFPEASYRVRTTRDGHHAIATGTYKPQMRVWDLDDLALKFERHTDAENVDFFILSDDWTKSIHLQNDRTIELHTQSGFHYRTRIPRFGRTLAYHFPSCDALFAGAGNEVYRLNLSQGQFLSPFVLRSGGGDNDADSAGGDTIAGVNAIDVNPAHQLFAFGVEGNGTVQFWDPRSRSRVGVLRLPRRGGGLSSSSAALSVTALASRSDGLSYAVGTSTGHTLLYDVRTTRSFATKDQGYGLPLKNVMWIEGGSTMAGDGMVLSADKKVIKIWERNSPSTNFASMTPASDLNHVHHVPGSGLLMIANEGIQMSAYYIPRLGPAPKWARFLENITEEMEGSVTRTVYEDYKFVERNELQTLGLDHLVGTPMLKPYMHGYFMKLQLYETARAIVNPFAYAEHREKVIREKMDKLAEGRIRARKDVGVKVNKGLAEKIQRDEERERKKEARRDAKRAAKATAADGEGAMREGEGEEGAAVAKKEKASLLTDPRFKKLFEHPDFEVDEESREFALLNPSTVAQRQSGRDRPRTAVEEEEDESDKPSSDGLSEKGSGSESDGSEDYESGGSDSDSDDHRDLRGGRVQQNERVYDVHSRRPGRNRLANLDFVPASMQVQPDQAPIDENATLGQLRQRSEKEGGRRSFDLTRSTHRGGGMETSWVPSARQKNANGQKSGKHPGKRKGVETFGAGMEKGPGEEALAKVKEESMRRGRTERRKGVRSGSKNVFRRISQ